MKGKCVICLTEDDVWSMRPASPILEEHTQVVCYCCEPYVLALREQKTICPMIYDSFFTGSYLVLLRSAKEIADKNEEERKKIRGLTY